LKKTNYAARYNKFGVHPKALGWHSKKAAEQRYEQIVRDINFKGKSILDVGCGFADIIPFIQKKAKNFEYTGVDIVPEFVRQAKKRNPTSKFVIRDYFENPLKKNFDVVLCVGSFNSNLKDNLNFRKKAIKTMFEYANYALIFSMAGRYPKPKTSPKSNVWFADPVEILEYCYSLTKKVVLRNHYHSRDFTIVMFR